MVLLSTGASPLRLFSLFLYRGKAPSSARLNYGTLHLRLVRASAYLIAMASIANLAFVPARITTAP
jgi:hypothetical protein